MAEYAALLAQKLNASTLLRNLDPRALLHLSDSQRQTLTMVLVGALAVSVLWSLLMRRY
jgi:hypothetical protein